ncbi:MAG: adenylyl-sulfate kinase [Cyanobacteria bacterium]|nr:adenylyl-sulfate kinase [Cyanobacteriota bacterium]
MTNKGLVLWFTGLSGAGKTTIATAVEQELSQRGCAVELLDGDVVRTHLSKGLGFSKEDRDTNIRRIGFVASLLCKHGVIAIAAAISPYRATRQEVRQMARQFVEVYVAAPLAVCEQRDVKGLYAKARAGKIQNFTGIDDPYEEPLAPEIVCHTEQESIQESVTRVITYLEEHGYVSSLMSELQAVRGA